MTDRNTGPGVVFKDLHGIYSALVTNSLHFNGAQSVYEYCFSQFVLLLNQCLQKLSIKKYISLSACVTTVFILRLVWNIITASVYHRLA